MSGEHCETGLVTTNSLVLVEYETAPEFMAGAGKAVGGKWYYPIGLIAEMAFDEERTGVVIKSAHYSGPSLHDRLKGSSALLVAQMKRDGDCRFTIPIETTRYALYRDAGIEVYKSDTCGWNIETAIVPIDRFEKVDERDILEWLNCDE